MPSARPQKLYKSALYEDRLNWGNYLSVNRVTSNSVLEAACKHVPPEELAHLQCLSEDMIERLAAQLNTIDKDEVLWGEFWRGVCSMSSLSNKFMAAHASDMDWGLLSSSCKRIPEDLLIRYADYMNWIKLCFSGVSITRRVVAECADKINWLILCRFGALTNKELFTPEFMSEHADSIVFDSLPVDLLSYEHIEKHFASLNWPMLSASTRHWPLWFIIRWRRINFPLLFFSFPKLFSVTPLF